MEEVARELGFGCEKDVPGCRKEESSWPEGAGVGGWVGAWHLKGGIEQSREAGV